MAEPQGGLPQNWLLSQVGSVGEVRLGRQRSPDKHTGRHTTPYVRAANITADGLDLSDLATMDFTPEERLTFNLRDGDVLLTEASGSAMQVGRSAIWRSELEGCCFQNTVLRFRSRAALPEYAYLVFRHYMRSGVFARTARGVGIQHLSASRLSRLPFPLPPISEQRRIVASAGARLEHLRSATELLRSSLQILEQQTSQVLAAATSGSFSRPGKAEWRQVRIAEAGEVTLGKARGTARTPDSMIYPYLRVANVYEDRLKLSNLNEMGFTRSEFARYRLLPGDILLNEGQSPELVGRPAVYRGELPDMCFQNSLIRFRPRGDLLVDFALIVFRHYLRSGVFRRESRSSTNIAHLSAARFAAMMMPLPALAEQAATVSEARDRLDSITAQRGAIAASLETLAMLEDQILLSATSGSLVSQNPNDLPAVIIKDKSPGRRPSRRSPTSSAAGDDPVSGESVTLSTPDLPSESLAAVVRRIGRPVSARELLDEAGFSSDDPAEVERFYVALRSELGLTLFAFDGDAENQLLGTAEHAAH